MHVRKALLATLILVTASWLAAVPFAGSAAPPAQTGTGGDRELFRFAVAGDCRTNPEAKDGSEQDRIWTVNARVYARLLREVAQHRAKVFFFTGDMIFGHVDNQTTMDRQYAFWRGMSATLMEAGTYVVPVPGNHETQVLTPKREAAQPLERMWRENMGDIIMDSARFKELTGFDLQAWNPANTPAVGGPDGYTTDQSKLSYSFDAAGMHFAVINTDATGLDAVAPTDWLEKDLAAAKARGVTRFFVFGHRPAFTYRFKKDLKPVGLDTYPAKRDRFWKVIEAYKADYFCSHQHLYHVEKPGRGKSWQVLAGSAGAPFEIKPEEATKPTDRMHAWVLVKVMASGKVVCEAYGFDDDMGQTRLIETWEM